MRFYPTAGKAEPGGRLGRLVSQSCLAGKIYTESDP